MPKRTSTIAKKFKPSQAALDAWHAGDLWGRFMLPVGWRRGNSPPCRTASVLMACRRILRTNPETAMDFSWGKVRGIQQEVYAMSRVSLERHDMILNSGRQQRGQAF